MAAHKLCLRYCQLPQQPTTAAYLPFPLSYVPVCNQHLWVHMRHILESVHDNLHCPTSMRVMWVRKLTLAGTLHVHQMKRTSPVDRDLLLQLPLLQKNWRGVVPFAPFAKVGSWCVLCAIMPVHGPLVYLSPLWTNVQEMGGSTTGRVIPAGVILAVAYP